jgi:hypothetical protein
LATGHNRVVFANDIYLFYTFAKAERGSKVFAESTQDTPERGKDYP